MCPVQMISLVYLSNSNKCASKLNITDDLTWTNNTQGPSNHECELGPNPYKGKRFHIIFIQGMCFSPSHSLFYELKHNVFSVLRTCYSQPRYFPPPSVMLTITAFKHTGPIAAPSLFASFPTHLPCKLTPGHCCSLLDRQYI